MTRVSYTVIIKDTLEKIETVSYKTVQDIKNTHHNVQVTTHYTPIQEDTAKPKGKRGIVLKYQGFIRPSTFQEDYQKAVEQGVV